MDLETLEARKVELDQRFNAVTTQRDELNVELNRIQGDYRTTVADIELVKSKTLPPADEPQEGEIVAPNGDVSNKEEEEDNAPDTN